MVPFGPPLIMKIARGRHVANCYGKFGHSPSGEETPIIVPCATPPQPLYPASSMISTMCSIGGGTDIEIEERIKARTYRCKECGERFKAVGKHPVCPSCQSEDVEEA